MTMAKLKKIGVLLVKRGADSKLVRAILDDRRLSVFEKYMLFVDIYDSGFRKSL